VSCSFNSPVFSINYCNAASEKEFEEVEGNELFKGKFLFLSFG
jgi:hypothetical protein